MPTAEEYIQGFNLYRGLILEDWELVNWEVGHEQVVLFNEYAYPTTLVFQPISSGVSNTTLLAAVEEYTSGIRIIHSQSGRPYKCLFSWLEPRIEVEKDRTLLHFQGYAKRIGKKEVIALENGTQLGWERN